jgi:hypothetical protein
MLVMSNSSWFRRLGSNEVGGDVDVAVDGLGVGADLVRRLGQRLRDVALDAGDADVKPRAQEERAAVKIQRDLGIDFRRGRELDLTLRGRKLDRADVAGRPGGAEQVFGRRMRLWQLDVEQAVLAAGSAVGAGGDVGLSGEENLGGHGEVLSAGECYRVRLDRMRCLLFSR